MAEPYYQDDHVQLWLGDCREIIPTLGRLDVVITDPPYGETSLPWDRWPEGWPALVAEHASSLWSFGSMRMFLRRSVDFANWSLAQDIVWEKGNGSGSAADRFRRVHEHILHWYRGPWRDVYHQTPRIPATQEQIYRNGGATKVRRSGVFHQGKYKSDGEWTETGTRLARSVIYASSMRGRAIHPTEKPPAILAPLIEYSAPMSGLVLDPFAGSCSTLLAARSLGRRAIGIEADEAMCEMAVKQRLAVQDLFTGEAS